MINIAFRQKIYYQLKLEKLLIQRKNNSNQY